MHRGEDIRDVCRADKRGRDCDDIGTEGPSNPVRSDLTVFSREWSWSWSLSHASRTVCSNDNFHLLSFSVTVVVGIDIGIGIGGWGGTSGND